MSDMVWLTIQFALQGIALGLWAGAILGAGYRALLPGWVFFFLGTVCTWVIVL